MSFPFDVTYIVVLHLDDTELPLPLHDYASEPTAPDAAVLGQGFNTGTDVEQIIRIVLYDTPTQTRTKRGAS